MKKKVILSLLLLLSLFILSGCTSSLKASKLVKVLENDGFTCEKISYPKSYDCIKETKKGTETFEIKYSKGSSITSNYKFENEDYKINNIRSAMYKENTSYPMSSSCVYKPKDFTFDENYYVKVGSKFVEMDWNEEKRTFNCPIEIEDKVNDLIEKFEQYHKDAGIDLNDNE